MNSSESANQRNCAFHIGIERSCQSKNANKTYFGLNHYCSFLANLFLSPTDHMAGERLCNVTSHGGSVGVLFVAGAVPAPANASIYSRSSGCCFKPLCFITPCSVSWLSAATDARNPQDFSSIGSHTELEELQCYPCMTWQSATHTPYASTTLLLSFYCLLQSQKLLKNAKNLWKAESCASYMFFFLDHELKKKKSLWQLS